MISNPSLESSPRLQITREVEIRSIHHLVNPSLSKEENDALYGRCHRPHGHNYKIQVTLEGPLNERSGLVCDRDHFDQLLREHVVDRLDGVDLNDVFPNTSCEALAIEVHAVLASEIQAALGEQIHLMKVGIQETSKNYFEFQQEQPKT